MIIVRLLRFLFGYTRFTALGGFSDRFFSLCAEKKIGLSQVVRTDSGIEAVVFAGNSKRVLECARQAGMVAEITGKGGLPQLIYRYRRRPGIPLGIILSFFLFSLWSSVIWSVSVSGNNKIPEQTLLTLLEECGVKRGVFRSNIDCDAVEDTLTDKIPLLSWVSVNIKGCRAELEITEVLEEPEIFDKHRYVNIVASRDGEILSADVFAGTGSVRVGYPVIKGDLLVSGVITLKNGGVRFVHSQAEIIARTNYQTEAIRDFKSVFSSADKEKSIYSLYLFGLKIPLGFAEKYDSSFECEYILSTGRTLFPVSVIRKRCTFSSEKETELTEKQAKLLCVADYAAKEESQMNADNLEKRTVVLEESGGTVKMTGNCYCHEDIALEQIFEVETLK